MYSNLLISDNERTTDHPITPTLSHQPPPFTSVDISNAQQWTPVLGWGPRLNNAWCHASQPLRASSSINLYHIHSDDCRWSHRVNIWTEATVDDYCRRSSAADAMQCNATGRVQPPSPTELYYIYRTSMAFTIQHGQADMRSVGPRLANVIWRSRPDYIPTSSSLVGSYRTVHACSQARRPAAIVSYSA